MRKNKKNEENSVQHCTCISFLIKIFNKRERIQYNQPFFILFFYFFFSFSFVIPVCIWCPHFFSFFFCPCSHRHCHLISASPLILIPPNCKYLIPQHLIALRLTNVVFRLLIHLISPLFLNYTYNVIWIFKSFSVFFSLYFYFFSPKCPFSDSILC